MTRKRFLHQLRVNAHIIFPTLTLLVAAVILISPMFPAPLRWIATLPAARFCLHWFMCVCVVLTFTGRPLRPAMVASAAGILCLVVSAVFWLVCKAYLPGPPDVATLLMPCLAGGILGALAGTWLIYVLQVLYDRR